MRDHFFLTLCRFSNILFGSCLWVAVCGGLGAAELLNPDFTKGGKVPEGASHDWNLGPTGVRGWMFSNKMETTDARQVYVTGVEQGSPADGVLVVGDVILGVAGKRFTFDPRTELGKAIGVAEGGNGKLDLLRFRGGEVEDVSMKIKVMGRYSGTAPFDCEKSKRIFEEGCRALAARMKADPKAGNGITRCLNALALLSSGNAGYLPVIRDQVEWAAKYSDVEGKSLHAWFYGPVNLLLAEYTLATGDRRFLPDLKRVTMEIVDGQSAVGSWGHRFVRDDGRLGGYGMMNAPGLPLTVSLVLARMAGVEDAKLDAAIEKSARLIRFYVGKGSVPYGDHHPWIQTHGDNGKNEIAAILFNLLGDREAAEYFSRMGVSSYGGERDNGHTGNFFNMLWAMPGVALSGPNASGAWMGEFGWYYDLARRWDGSFLHQGPPEARPDKYRNWDCSGAYLLAYGQSLRKIYLTGKKGGVVPQISVVEAEKLIEDGRGWSSKDKGTVYENRGDEVLFEGLRSWSPVVRERSAMALEKRGEKSVSRLVKMLGDDALYARLGACQALGKLGKKGAPAVAGLRGLLGSDDLWLRVKAAEALAAIGEDAKSAVPELLEMLADEDFEADPRGMQQRYLCFVLFDRRGGLLRKNLDGVDRKALYSAVRAGLRNEDGRARGVLASIYDQLSYEEIELLLPAIYEAVVEPAPSGIMFANGVRLSGLKILAKHRIKEGMGLCLSVMAIDQWGKQDRISKGLDALEIYGGAAKSMLPALEKLEAELKGHREAKSLKKQIDHVRSTIEVINAADEVPVLRSLKP